jgi:hypothetical protein
MDRYDRQAMVAGPLQCRVVTDPQITTKPMNHALSGLAHGPIKGWETTG